MRILVLNAGSSSLKFDLWEMDGKLVLRDEVERVSDWDQAIESVLRKTGDSALDAVGHRIVHGGDRFHSAVEIDDGVAREIDALSDLAPLHNPHNLAAVRAARKRWPQARHVAVFDTAFHRTLPPRAYVYALPWDYQTREHIRRYGFHGISHEYSAWRFAQIHGKRPEDYRLITCHLGNGCSVCAIENGKSIDTSMGFTPLEGLVMGSRAGDVDAGAILYLMMHEKLEPETVLHRLNSDSGLKGLSGISNDMRDILAQAGAGNSRAALAVDVFCYRVRKYIGAYLAAMNGADALIFTGGIGENSNVVRSRICQDLTNLGIAVDEAANNEQRSDDRQIGAAKIPVWVVAANEEWWIAREALRVHNSRIRK